MSIAEIEAVLMDLPDEQLDDLWQRVAIRRGMSAADEEGYDPVWLGEMNRRMDEIEAGTAKTFSAEEIFDALKARRHARTVS